MGGLSCISIHALLAESDARRESRQQPAGISIHALLAESDCLWDLMGGLSCISIHALLAESDAEMVSRSSISCQFLSTLSLRRATPRLYRSPGPNRNFYPRSPCGERLRLAGAASAPYKFLSTLSLRRATVGKNQVALQYSRFLSTLSLRRATWDAILFLPSRLHFYPRSPCGERLQKSPSVGGNCNFYPRSPCGERLFDFEL